MNSKPLISKRDRIIAECMNMSARRYAASAIEYANDNDVVRARRMASSVRAVYFTARHTAETLYPTADAQNAFMAILGAGIPEALGEIAALLKACEARNAE